MIRSYNGIRLLSSHLIRNSCKSIYEGVFHRTLDSAVEQLHVINLNKRVLSNTSIRGSASLSIQDYQKKAYRPRFPTGGCIPDGYDRNAYDYDFELDATGEIAHVVQTYAN
ncbi:hypothetical protein TSUD_315270 [Trifolium subterraneum]|uniref:Uncharacterized protein n=1 Tax=Trifolium subterraneum TaxID=3900 RepID=A0A2Z6MH98_TRISU|nr:hypothetical protein TSUD_315270 [Trifolium subterraneum]